jgi:hypothetical protein
MTVVINSKTQIKEKVLKIKQWVSMDFVLQEHGVPHDGPKDSNAGG